ncbi:MAG: D-alanyl-D-alanine carboxypeptidase, partial [Pseudomonadota bacterium]
MSLKLTRRTFVNLALGAAASPGLAFAPDTVVRPQSRDFVVPRKTGADIVAQHGLRGRVAFALVDVDDPGQTELMNPDQPMAPASVTKAMTAAFALDQLGADHRFTTQVLGTGPFEDGVLEGDLVLVGSGDPTLDTDRLGSLLLALRDQGLRRVTGRLILNGGGFPALAQIDASQPPQVGYNPAIAGLNLNFNRVRFDWTRWEDLAGYKMTMRASGKRFEPDVVISRIIPVERDLPVYSHRYVTGGEEWEVSRAALGNSGGRWIPTRVPMRYTGEAFRGIARQLQIQMPEPEFVAIPEGTRVLAQTHSAPLTDIAKDMLRYSTNLTAEVLGFAASRVSTLQESAQALSTWVDARGMQSQFVDHSGLGVASQVTANGLM